MYDFKKLTHIELSKIEKKFNNFPWENKNAYVDFLSNMYYFVSQACRLLTSSASRCDLSLDQFHQRFIDHAAEERNHEKLVTSDLRSLKAELNSCRYSMPPVWQTQFYLIENKDPLSLFGYILYFESLSLEPQLAPLVYERLRKTYGRGGTNYFRVHVEEDADHLEKLYEILKELPSESQQSVFESLLITSSLYQNFMNEISQDFQENKTMEGSSLHSIAA